MLAYRSPDINDKTVCVVHYLVDGLDAVRYSTTLVVPRLAENALEYFVWLSSTVWKLLISF